MVTGGGSGTGKATALSLFREGAVVAVGDLAVESGEERANEIKEGGGEAVFVNCDVASRDASSGTVWHSR